MTTVENESLAREILASVGGPGNVSDATHCMTRLRITLKDPTVPNDAAVEAIEGVKGVMRRGSEYQVIVGSNAQKVLGFFTNQAGIEEADSSLESAQDSSSSLFNRFTGSLSACIVPIIGPLIASGVIKGILAIAAAAGVTTSADSTYQMICAGADAVLYFLPILVGFSAGKVFGANPYTSAVIGAALVYPTLADAVSAGGFTFFGIPVVGTAYSGTLFPALFSVFFAAKLEKALSKVIPDVLQLMMVPTLVLIVTVPLAWLVMGPVINWVTGLLGFCVAWLFEASPLLSGAFLGAFWQLAVAFGFSHGVLAPMVMNNLTVLGYDPVNAVASMTVWALAGAALGYALRSRDAKKRAEGISDMVTCLCGVTEPMIYSIALPNPAVFASACIGGGVSGAVVALLGAKIYSLTSGGLFCIPAFINPAGLDANLAVGVIGMLVAFFLSAAVSFAISGRKKTAA